ncbi:hypothetical protein DJ017_08040 [Phenylobacterium soli]|uniref:Uncharacterized protein n=3 Tax=Phenylobacterium soli TaxID=2170551 RepID=A0A328AMY4_9CAUL|nr:hypothetical protein DJ017_08040 [Phenylobacterium soli]
MTAAGSRCGLFTPDLARALAAAAAQARGAALRAGASAEEIAQTERIARGRAAGADCRSKDVTVAADRVRQAFAGFSRVNRIAYPGDVAGWQADRYVSAANPWRLKQDTAFGADRMSFGLAGREDAPALLAVGRFADGAQPYAARLVMRDEGRSAGPYLQRVSLGATTGLPLARRMPPPAALTSVMAEARQPAGRDLLPKDQAGKAPAWAFRFPAPAARALAALDPREAIAVDFLFPGDRVRRAYVEVGDFAAGRAFVQMTAR